MWIADRSISQYPYEKIVYAPTITGSIIMNTAIVGEHLAL